ncbi:MAG: hypothetical protein IRZ01_11735, partial [Thermoflavifilum aggregans]|nr:hypothetical protein [Thermoflavifilum aggregans]
MKKIFVRYLLIVLATVQPAWVLAQQWQASCNLQLDPLTSYPVTATLQSSTGTPLNSIESGKDFNLNITLPGLGNQICSGGYYVVNIQTSDNLTLGSQPASTQYPFVQTSSNPPVFRDSIPTTSGYGLNIPFHFLPGTTCNGETGTFKITIKATCGSHTDSCVLNVSLKAIAQNYWKVTKQWLWGNLSGGYVKWRIVLQNTNPNPGIGDLNIYSGTITDAITGSNSIVNVFGASGVTGLGTGNVTWNTGPISVYNTYVTYDVWTKMCDPAGTLVQNCVNYSFCLGKPTVSTGTGNTNPANPSARQISQLDSVNALAKPLPTSPAGGPVLIPPISFCCASASGQACDTVRLVK